MNVLKYFQQQRLEYTRQLRKEIKRLEKLENVYLAALKKVGNEEFHNYPPLIDCQFVLTLNICIGK